MYLFYINIYRTMLIKPQGIPKKCKLNVEREGYCKIKNKSKERQI